MADAISTDEIDTRVREIVTIAIGEMGGPIEMVRRNDQDILPALVESAYALVLHDEAHQDTGTIANFLGISPGAVEAVFGAPMEAHLARLHYREDAAPVFPPHTEPDATTESETGRQEPEFIAGALAKFAYDIVNRRRRRQH